jgi:hypothetical protein
MSIPPAI